jgi:hypothetical protein
MRTSFVLLFIVTLTSCGPAYHLRKAEEHIEKAKELGAKFRSDTTHTDIATPSSETEASKPFETVRTDQGLPVDRGNELDDSFMDILHDTVTIETTKWRTKTFFDTVERKVYQKVFIKGDTIRVPMEVNNSTEATGTREIFKWVSFLLVLLIILIGVLRWRKQ